VTAPLVSLSGLLVRLEHAEPVVLDATVALAKPRHDGDHTSESGLAGWAAEHIPGSRHADLLEALSDPEAAYHFARPAPEALARALAALGVTDGAEVVVYDRADGLWAARLWWLLDWLGVPAGLLDGGLKAWRDAGLPVESGPAPAPITGGVLTPRPRDGRWVTREDVQRWLDGGADANVVCALGPDVYSGAAPTRYARRGHIPGTGNVPARTLLAADGRYLPVERLREVLADLLADERPIWLYCGGGISATVLGFALRAAGRDDVALYDGSLEEWAADPELPLVTGDAPVALPAEVRDLLDRPEFAVLSTTEPDGSAQLGVMWAGRDGDHVLMATKGTRRKVANLRRDPRVTVLLYDRARPTRYAEIRGTATVTGQDAHALINELALRYTGRPHEVTDPAQEADRVVLRIVPTRVLYRS
jgi:PPOX class probable F420-dependent enzyme